MANVAADIERRRAQGAETRMRRKAAKTAALKSQLKQALNGWDLKRPGEEDEGLSFGGQHPGAAALLLVKEALGEFNLPSPPSVRWAGMKRESGRAPYHIDEGRIDVEAELMSLSGVKHWIRVPVWVRSGRMLHPGILFHNELPRVMTQGTFDEIIKSGEIVDPPPERRNMYSPPPEPEYRVGPKLPAVQQGLFGVSPRRLSAQKKDGENADAEHIDRAEMPVNVSFFPSQKVKLKNEVQVVDRGGVTYTISKGTKGKVIRDIAGDNRQYYVDFPSVGFSATIEAEDLA